HLWKTFENENGLVFLLKIQDEKLCHYEGNVKVRFPYFFVTRNSKSYQLLSKGKRSSNDKPEELSLFRNILTKLEKPC
ncbi:MAG: hypothetical protein WCC82_08405, partial [Nitrososphaeraceae archaeon]